jgi:ribonuclease P/MRP protein subunit POP1
MPFFSSLIFTGTRVAGQLERQTQAYESGITYYPRDYPSTDPYNAYASERVKEEKATWDRKPPAKRVNYDKLGTKNPWKADWAGILGIRDKAGDQDEDEDQNLITTQRETSKTSLEGKANVNIRPWLLRGSEVPKILSSMSAVFNQGAALLSEINRLRFKRRLPPLSNTKHADLLQGALTNVKLTMCLRGSPQDLALIYILNDDLCRKWEKLIRKQTALLPDVDEETPEENEVCNLIVINNI